MFGRFLDRIDERLAAEDDAHKRVEALQVGASLVAPHLAPEASLADLAAFLAKAQRQPDVFYGLPAGVAPGFRYAGGRLTFDSALPSGSPVNDLVDAWVPRRPGRRRAVVILRHWNAGADAYKLMARVLDRAGVTPVLLTLPHHGRRSAPDARVADAFLSANLGRTVQSVRQSVVDARCVLDWLAGEGYDRFGVIGASLGSCVASLATVADTRIGAAALLLTAGDFADAVWTGRATRHIRKAFDGAITLPALRSVWSILSPATFVDRLTRPGLRLLLLSALRDTVILPEDTRRYVALLRGAHADVTEVRFRCGHYTMGVPPFGLMALARLLAFFRNRAWPQP